MITHEQAAIIRAAQADDTEIVHLMQNGLAKGYPATEYGPTEAGAKAVAEYDAHYITIEREEIERLQALERKIEVFFKGLNFGNREIVGPGQMQIGYAYSKGAYYCTSQEGTFETVDSFGDAMRKAFELFEMSEERVKP